MRPTSCTRSSCTAPSVWCATTHSSRGSEFRAQRRWAEHFGCGVGRDSAESLQNALLRAWRDSDAATRRRPGDVVHVMIDRDLEETYHGLFMKELMNAAGVPTTFITTGSDLVALRVVEDREFLEQRWPGRSSEAPGWQIRADAYSKYRCR